MTTCPLSKNCQLENEFVSVDYTLKVVEKQFSDMQKRRKFGYAEEAQVQRVQDQTLL